MCILDGLQLKLFRHLDIKVMNLKLKLLGLVTENIFVSRVF